MDTDQDGPEFTEREKAIIEAAVMYFASSATVHGNHKSGSDARRVHTKVREWRDDATIPDTTGVN